MLQDTTHLLEGNHPDEASDAGDVGVVQPQQGEDGVGLEEESSSGWKHLFGITL